MRTYSNPFRYEIPEKLKNETIDQEKPTTYIAWFGKKYFIWKGKALKQSLDNLAVQIDRCIRHGTPKDSAFSNIIKYVVQSRMIYFKVEILLQSDNGFFLLKSETLLLRKAKKDKNCLNRFFDAYVPQWMDPKEIKQFTQWESKNNKKKRATAKNNKVLSSRRTVRAGKKKITKRKSSKV